MAGFNLHTYLGEMRQELTLSRQDRRSTAAMPDAEALRRISHALAYIQSQKEVLQTRENPSSQSLVSGQAEYSITNYRVGDSIREVGVVDADNRIHWLTQLDPSEHDSIYNATDAQLLLETGTPKYFTLNLSGAPTVVLRPTPNWTKAAGLFVRFSEQEDYLVRCMNLGASRTAAVTNGSATVTIGGGSAAADYPIARYDEFGVAFNVNTDGTAETYQPPVRWYRIASTPTLGSTAVFTIDPVYGEATAAAAQCITAQVPQLEQRYPMKLFFAPVYRALEEYFGGRRSPEIAGFYAKKFHEYFDPFLGREYSVSGWDKGMAAISNSLAPTARGTAYLSGTEPGSGRFIR